MIGQTLDHARKVEEASVTVSKARILVADPDPDVQRTLQLYLEEHNHEVQTFERIGQVMKVARPWQPHVILLSTDSATTEEAYQVCKALLDDTLTGHIPVVMLLHVDERQARLAALEAGANDVVSKPFDLEELYLRIEASIRLSTMRFGS